LVRKLFLYRIPLPGLRSATERRLLGEFFSHREEREVDWVVGACMLVRREVWEETGGFHPHIFMYGEEQEWCARIRRSGWSVHFSPEVEVIHRRAASSGSQGARWRMRSALEGDLAVLRTLRGPGYARTFAWIRWGATCFHTGATALLAGITRSPEWQGRNGEAWLVTREQWNILRGRPSPGRGRLEP
jgi:GT2 family glycosyltransferase